MIAADQPVQRPHDAKLLVVDREGRITHAPRSRFVEYLRPGDLVVANDAATLPASLHGVHQPSGADIEVRLAGIPPLAFRRVRHSGWPRDARAFSAIVFGAGDFHTRTEDRRLPPPLAAGDRLAFGHAPSVPAPPLSATIVAVLDHPRLVVVRFDCSSSAVWEALARHGRPIQYAHMTTALALWDVWTPIAAAPAAFEPPSASFVLDWKSIRAMRQRGITLATITLAAGISSTGDPELDRRLPFDEPYRIPEATASAVCAANARKRRVVAIGTTVVRALEHAAACDGIVRGGHGVASQRLGSTSELRIVDAILSGTHEPESSHHQLLRAFVDNMTMTDIDVALETQAYRTHEFGDSVLIEKHERIAADRAA